MDASKVKPSGTVSMLETRAIWAGLLFRFYDLRLFQIPGQVLEDKGGLVMKGPRRLASLSRHPRTGDPYPQAQSEALETPPDSGFVAPPFNLQCLRNSPLLMAATLYFAAREAQ